MRLAGLACVLGAIVLLALSSGCRKTEEGATTPTGEKAQIVLTPLEKAIYDYQIAFVRHAPLFNVGEGKRYAYKECEAAALEMSRAATAVVDADMNALLPKGPQFHKDARMIAENTHRLLTACATRMPDYVKQHWERLARDTETMMPPKIDKNGVVLPPVPGSAAPDSAQPQGPAAPDAGKPAPESKVPQSGDPEKVEKKDTPAAKPAEVEKEEGAKK